MKYAGVLLVVLLFLSCNDDEASPDPLAESLICYLEELNDGTQQIVTIRPDGTDKRVVLDSETTRLFEYDACPNWSFDLKRIFFKSPESDIFSIDRDGRNLIRHTNSPRYRSTPSLSPDGTAVVFSARDSLWNHQIFTLNLAQQEEKQLTFFTEERRSVECYSPTWSRDGKKIVFNSNYHDQVFNVYCMNSDGTDIQKVTDNTSRSALRPRLSPDGSAIIYHTYRDDASACDIFRIRTTGANKKQLTSLSDLHAEYAVDPCWSPDGKKILFAAYTLDRKFDGYFTMNADGTEVSCIDSTSTIKAYADWK